LTICIFLPLAGAAALCLLPGSMHALIRANALITAAITFILVLFAMGTFYQAQVETGGGYLSETGNAGLQHKVTWIGSEPAGNTALPVVEIQYHVALDGVSLWLVALTAFLTPLAIWASFTGIRQRVKEYYVLMLLLETAMLGVFCARDLLLFYVFFEFTLIPLFFIIGIWGGADRHRAAMKFFIYTIAGSVLTFAGILCIGYHAYRTLGQFTFDLVTLYELGGNSQNPLMPANVQWWIFLAFAAGFAVKVPLFPLHTWLPLAHTEAPTAGSVILAGVLLKLGTYGFLRINLPMLPHATEALAPIVGALAVMGIIYGALVAWVQEDVKKLVAYSSVSHLGFCILGMFSLKMAGATGSLVYMINHGLSTGALFLVIGMMYERYHTRSICEIGGLAKPMPWLAFFLIFFTLSSIGLPGLNGFIGEFLVLLGTFTSDSAMNGEPAGPLGVTYAVLAATGIVLSAIYMLWMCQCVLFGPLKHPPNTPDRSAGLRPDLGPREIAILVPIALVCIWIGVYPKGMLTTIQPAMDRQVLSYVRHMPPQDQQNRGTPPLLLEAKRNTETTNETSGTPVAKDVLDRISRADLGGGPTTSRWTTPTKNEGHDH
jgi:NADH-quinone oxidoreductase subunit M